MESTSTQKIDLYEFIDKMVKLSALDLAPAAPIPRNDARSAPMEVTAPQAAWNLLLLAQARGMAQDWPSAEEEEVLDFHRTQFPLYQRKTSG